MVRFCSLLQLANQLAKTAGLSRRMAPTPHCLESPRTGTARPDASASGPFPGGKLLWGRMAARDLPHCSNDGWHRPATLTSVGGPCTRRDAGNVRLLLCS